MEAPDAARTATRSSQPTDEKLRELGVGPDANETGHDALPDVLE